MCVTTCIYACVFIQRRSMLDYRWEGEGVVDCASRSVTTKAKRRERRGAKDRETQTIRIDFASASAFAVGVRGFLSAQLSAASNFAS